MAVYAFLTNDRGGEYPKSRCEFLCWKLVHGQMLEETFSGWRANAINEGELS